MIRMTCGDPGTESTGAIDVHCHVQVPCLHSLYGLHASAVLRADYLNNNKNISPLAVADGPLCLLKKIY